MTNCPVDFIMHRIFNGPAGEPLKIRLVISMPGLLFIISSPLFNLTFELVVSFYFTLIPVFGLLFKQRCNIRSFGKFDHALLNTVDVFLPVRAEGSYICRIRTFIPRILNGLIRLLFRQRPFFDGLLHCIRPIDEPDHQTIVDVLLFYHLGKFHYPRLSFDLLGRGQLCVDPIQFLLLCLCKVVLPGQFLGAIYESLSGWGLRLSSFRRNDILK